ncbi:MFS transporter [Mycobacterium sp. ACS4331]|uniref:MFS transporter n=1 Tax=Mycobacterium sp. ACS4331 TaxID=1834121 RepID=UPI000AB1CEE4|nr:MFS transporter [Mycobacterium sp. ACS4331]
MKESPARAPWILGVLLVAAGVANINMSIANVALADIAHALDATQSQQNLIADAFTMSLAATVLYLGAVGDRYGRKALLLWGAAVSVPASLVAAWAPSVDVLVGARIVGGIGAALLFPTTLSLISVLWRGKARAGAIALWSGVGGSTAFLGSVVAGALLLWFWWGSVFLLTAPFAAALLVVAAWAIPPDEDLDTEPVDHLGGLLSIIAVAALVLAVQEITEGNSAQLVILLVVAVLVTALFLLRQRTAQRPLVDLRLARQPTFLIASLAGSITFGALIGGLYIGQQFTANVLQYNTFQSAATTIPAALTFLLGSPVASRWMTNRGGRFTLSVGIVCIGIGFVIIALLWNPGSSVWVVLLPYAILGAGTSFAGAAASTAIMGSLPTHRAGMGSSFTDLTRDFGGALIQALMAGALTITYSSAMMTSYASLPAEEAERTSQAAAEGIAGSYQKAESVAGSYPPASAEGLLRDAATAFSTGKTYAFVIAIVLVALALIAVWRWYPGREREAAVFASYAAD